MSSPSGYPDSDMLPSNLRSIRPILDVGRRLYRTSHTRLAFLCCRAALDKAIALSGNFGVRPVIAVLSFWILWNDKTKQNGKLAPTDALDMQNFYLYIYNKRLKPMIFTPTSLSDRKRFDNLSYACESACVLHEVMDILWKDWEWPPEIVEARAHVKDLSRTFMSYMTATGALLILSCRPPPSPSASLEPMSTHGEPHVRHVVSGQSNLCQSLVLPQEESTGETQEVSLGGEGIDVIVGGGVGDEVDKGRDVMEERFHHDVDIRRVAMEGVGEPRIRRSARIIAKHKKVCKD